MAKLSASYANSTRFRDSSSSWIFASILVWFNLKMKYWTIYLKFRF